ncbi:MAG: hypothetical protein NTU94_14065 [Planctomycetota bacterium]|nr:hypothetical protein [Planctomycetota bacterium]
MRYLLLLVVLVAFVLSPFIVGCQESAPPKTKPAPTDTTKPAPTDTKPAPTDTKPAPTTEKEK